MLPARWISDAFFRITTPVPPPSTTSTASTKILSSEFQVRRDEAPPPPSTDTDLVARVQKIINADPERLHTSKNAAFAIALATEMFIQHLATTTHNVVKAERKPRRNIQYRDVASAVAKTDNLEFLVDVVPKTTTYKEFKKKQEGKGKGKAAEGAANGQTTLAGPSVSSSNLANGNGTKADGPEQNGHAKENGAKEIEEVEEEETPEAMEVDDDEEEQPTSSPEVDQAAMQIEMEMRGPRANGTNPVERRTSGFTAINGTK